MPSTRIRSPRSIVVAAAVFFAAVFLISAWRWWTFQYETFDVAFYVQALWLALRGEFHVSLLDVPLLGNHVEPLVFLLAPFFAVWPHPMLLVGAQAVALATMPCSAWRISRRLGLDEKTCFWLSLATVLTPAAGFIAIHEFHPEAFAAPLLLLLIEARLARRYVLFWIWFAAVLSCKENMALLLVAWGAVLALDDWFRGLRGQWRWNLAPLLVAAAWFLLCTQVITPVLNRGKVDYVELYSHLGSSGGEIIKSFFLQPGLALGAFWKALTHGNLVWGLLLPLLGLSLLRPKWLLIGAPILLQHLLSWRTSEWMIHLHYAAPLLPLFWIAAAEAFTSLDRQRTIARMIGVACIAAQVWLGPAIVLAQELPHAPRLLWERKWKAELLAAISPDASVAAGMPYLSHLGARRELYSMHHILKGLKTLSRVRYEPPETTDCVVVDYDDAATFDASAGYYHPQMRTVDGTIVPSSDRLLHEFLRPASWRVAAKNGLTVFTRTEQAQTTAEPQSSPSETAAAMGLQRVVWRSSGEGIVRLSSAAPAVLELTWSFREERAVFPWLDLYLKGDGGEFVIRRGLSAVEAVSEAAEEWQVLAPPEIPPGRYQARAFFWNRAEPGPTPPLLHAQQLGELEVMPP